MLFNSYEFILCFLPLTWIGWRLCLRLGGLKTGIGWLALASMGFYAWWDWRFLPLLVGSMLVNFLIGRRLSVSNGLAGRGLLTAGLLWNLGLLGYFKYWNFFATNLNLMTGSGFQLEKIILPLGISFFTFQKIAFLVDAYKGRVRDVKLLDFSLFVMFFPQLIAGPIVHHDEFIPQLKQQGLVQLDARRLALGLSVFAAGLFQKSVVADTLAPIADSVFGLVARGTHLRVVEAWTGLVAYTLQLFYDFSGYSHMAIGLALLFGLRLPINFLAPYTSRSMIEFWRRWHVTLSSFLRDYVYIPLGGNRRRHLANLLITMLLGGLWHGAGWTFILWGAWHGLALLINHLWRNWRGPRELELPGRDRLGWAWALTLVVVGFGWVLFRAKDLSTAWLLFQSLVGWHGVSVPVSWDFLVESLAPAVRARGLLPNINPSFTALLFLLAAGWMAVRGPRLLAWFGVTQQDLTRTPDWQAAELAPAGTGFRNSRALVAGFMLALALTALSRNAPFLYFQF